MPSRLPEWLESDDSEVLVGVDTRDVPVAVAHVTLLSSTEAWIEAARVHPGHRRKGLGKSLNHAGVRWAAERGGRVMRLATEASNEPARAQVLELGYRVVSTWVFGDITVSPNHRAPDQFRLRPAPGSDADAAWLFWAASDLAREGRDLIASGWQWRTARPSDIAPSSGKGQLMQSAAGWVRVEQPDDEWMRASWMATTPDDLLALLDGLLDLSAERSIAELDVMLPSLGWTSEAIRRVGGVPKEILIHSKPIRAEDLPG